MIDKIKNFLERRNIKIDIIILLSLISICILANLPALFFVKADSAMLNVLSVDEWSYSEFLESSFYNKIEAFNIKGILTLNDCWGYGSIFFFVYGLFGIIPHFFSNFSMEIVAMRILSFIWLGVTIFFVYKIIYFLSKKYFNAIIGALATLTIPAYYFYSKAFSAEFMICAFTMASIYFLIKDQYKGDKNYLISVALLAVAVGIKISIIVFCPIYLIYIILVFKKQNLLKFIKICFLSLFFFVSFFIVSNPYLILNGRAGINHYINGLQSNMLDNKTGHGGVVEGIDYLAWYNKIITINFISTTFFIVILIIFIVNIYYEAKKKKYNSLLLLSLFLLYTFYIIISVKKLWSWYLFPSFFIPLIGVFIFKFDYLFKKKNIIKYEKIILILFVCVLLFANIEKIGEKYQEIISRENKADFQIKKNSKNKFDNWLLENNIDNIWILKTPYIYFDPSIYNNIKVQIIWGGMEKSDFNGVSPDFLLVEKNSGFLKNADEMKQQTNYQEMLSALALYETITTSGIEINNEMYYYPLVLETESFFVHKRVMK